MSGGGYGRGGRGAALLAALSKPARKPGQSPGEEQNGVGQNGNGPARPQIAPMGRGAYLANLLQQTQLKEQKSAAGQSSPLGRSTGPSPQLSGGRGMLLIQQQAASPTPASVPVSQPTGRGAFLQSALAAQTAKMQSPQRPKDPSPIVPTQQMSQLEVTDKPAVIRHGSSGKQISLSANHIAVRCNMEHVYQYAVSFSPQIDSKNMRFKMVNEHRETIGFTKQFDGAILYLPKKLDQMETVLRSVRHTDGAQVTITIKLVKIVKLQSMTTLFNVIFRRIMSILGMVQVSRHYYDPRRPAIVENHRLEIWPGYITSIHEREGGLLLLADVSHRVLRMDTVLDVMNRIIQQNARSFQDECLRQLVGCTVLTRYNNKTYRIDDIEWTQTPEATFSTSSGEAISYIDYYRKSYNLHISDTKQPLLINRPKKRDQRLGGAEIIALIPELCYMSGLTDDIRSDFRVMKDLAVHTRVSPEQRQMSMKKFIHTVNNNQEARNELEKWGLCLDSSTVSFQGRLLPEEDIFFRNSNFKAGREADWGRHIGRENCILGVDLRHWMVLYTNRDKNRAHDFIKVVQQEAPKMGIDVQFPKTVELMNDRTDTYLSLIRKSLDSEVQMVVTIFPTSRDDRYNAVKKLCLVDAPVATQVINSRTIGDQRKLRSVCQKIILQMNAKLGGELWAVNMPVRNTMICGIDVYHEGKGGKAQSIGAFCASMNKMCTRWFSNVCRQAPGEELISGLKMCLSRAIKKYHELNDNSLPDRIILFRDGVGDGQLDVVANYEVAQLQACFKEFGETYQPRLAVIVVQKRINQRIYAELQGRGRESQYDNPPPGTVVDHTITRKEWYDFFLVSQHVRQGTVSPTHYIVVHDGSGLSPDQVQRISYKMTHLYYNWSGTVRVPAPCQYAHKLAYLVGQNLRDKNPHTSHKDKLFFL